MFFSFLAFCSICCLSLKRTNLQIIDRGRDPLRFPIRWHRSNSILSWILNLSGSTSCTFFSQSFQVSFVFSIRLSIQRLFLRDLSSNSISFSYDFSDTSLGSKRSFSNSFMSDANFLISFLTVVNSSSSVLRVNSRLFVTSVTSLEILSKRSFVVAQRCSVKKVFLENSQNSQIHLCQSLFFSKVAALLKKKILEQLLFCEFWEISKSTLP